MEHLKGSTTSSVPLKLLSSESPTPSNFPPLAFSFTFYAPVESSIASYFYSEEPTHRSTTHAIELDEELWGNERSIQKEEAKSVIQEDRVDEFIGSAIDQGEDDGEATKGNNRDANEEDDEVGRKRGRKRRPSWDEDDVYAGALIRGSLKRRRSIESTEQAEEEESRSESPKRHASSRRVPLPSQSTLFGLAAPRSLDMSIHEITSSLNQSSYAPYLSSEPVPPSISDEYGSTLIRFFRWVESPRLWDKHPTSRVFDARCIPDLALYARRYSPNFEAIRTNYPLQRLSRQESNSKRDTVTGNTKLCFEIVEWIWDKPLDTNHLRWIVELAPIALFSLVIEHVAVRRFLQAVRHAQTRFIEYLSTSIDSTLSSRARRAKTLVEWLEKGGTRRWEKFFTSTRGRDSQTGKIKEEPWEWWFYDLEDAGAVQDRTVEELDERERREE